MARTLNAAAIDLVVTSAPLAKLLWSVMPRVPTARDLVAVEALEDGAVKGLRERHVAVEYMVSDTEGHGLFRRDSTIEFYARAARFIDEHVR